MTGMELMGLDFGAVLSLAVAVLVSLAVARHAVAGRPRDRTG